MPAVGWLPDVVPNAPILSAWGNDIRNRSNTVVATIADRDAIVNKVAGMVVYVVATDAFYWWNGTRWFSPSKGALGFAYAPAIDITTNANAMQVNVQLAETRRVRIETWSRGQIVTSGPSTVSYRHYVNGAMIRSDAIWPGIAVNNIQVCSIVSIWDLTAGANAVVLWATSTPGAYRIAANGLFTVVQDLGIP
jgi:hypothetical protein